MKSRRRGDDHRPDVQGVAAEGAALARDRARRASAPTARTPRSSPRAGERDPSAICDVPTVPTRIFWHPRTRSSAAGRSSEIYELTEDRPLVPATTSRSSCDEEDCDRGGAVGARRSPRSAQAKKLGYSDRQIAHLLGDHRGRGPRARARRPGSCRSTGWWTPARRSSGLHAVLLLDLRRRERERGRATSARS